MFGAREVPALAGEEALYAQIRAVLTAASNEPKLEVLKQFNDDRSLTLYVQTERPEETKKSNWLPAPKGEFSPYIRAYWPGAAIAEGR
jgi:hypothetical protein